MSTLKEITSEEEWNQHVASLPPTTLQIISFHAPWAARKCLAPNLYATQTFGSSHALEASCSLGDSG